MYVRLYLVTRFISVVFTYVRTYVHGLTVVFSIDC